MICTSSNVPLLIIQIMILKRFRVIEKMYSMMEAILYQKYLMMCNERNVYGVVTTHKYT